MGSKGHCTNVFAGTLLLICGVLAIIAATTIWWTGDSGNMEFSLWEMTFEYDNRNEKKIVAKHQDMCKDSKGELATYCSKINAARATTIMTAIFGIAQAIFLLWLYCKPRIWLQITCLILGFFTFGSAISAKALGIQLAADNSLISSPGAGFICVCIAAVFALVGLVLNIVGNFLRAKGGTRGCGGCSRCCDCCPEGGTGSTYGGHQRFHERPPVSGGGWKTPVGGPPMKPPMPTVQPQMIPYQVPVPVSVSAQQPPPPQQINLNIRAVGPPAVGGFQASPPNPPGCGFQAPPPNPPIPVYRGDDFGIASRE